MPAEFGRFRCALMILTDTQLSKDPKLLTRKQHCNAEWAVTQKMNEPVEQHSSTTRTCASGANDGGQVVERIVKALMASRASCR